MRKSFPSSRCRRRIIATLRYSTTRARFASRKPTSWCEGAPRAALSNTSCRKICPKPGKSKLYLFKNNRITIFTGRDGLPNALMQKILEDRAGNLWMASGKFEEGGLVKFENGRLHAFTKEEGFTGVGVLSLTEDREGAIWAGISDNGLMRITPRFITSFTKEKNGLSSNNIYPLYEDAGGAIWSGAWRYGSERIGGVDKSEDGVFKNFAGENEITSLAPTSLFKDRDDNFWIGALGGLTKYKDGAFTKF